MSGNLTKAQLRARLVKAQLDLAAEKTARKRARKRAAVQYENALVVAWHWNDKCISYDACLRFACGRSIVGIARHMGMTAKEVEELLRKGMPRGGRP